MSVLAPTPSSKYYRLTWTDPDGRPGRTSAGTDLDGAIEKAALIAARLDRAAGPSGALSLRALVDTYTSTSIGRRQGTEGGDLAPTTTQEVKRALNRSIDGYGDVQCWDVDRELLDRMRAQAGTNRVVNVNTSALRGLLQWGHRMRVFGPQQAALLPERCPPVNPSRAGTAAPSRRRPGRRAEESATYIRSEDAPAALQVVAIGRELAVPFPDWGRLAPEVAAGCGLRWGEQFQLTAYDVFLEEHQYTAEGWRRPFVAVEAQVDPSARVKDGGDRRKLPKLEKTRSVGIPPVSFTGYPLREELRRRRDQALAEQAAGTNPQALLFPTVTGKMFHHSAFSNQYLVPAALRCTQSEWPTRTWAETYAKRNKVTGSHIESTRTRTQLLLTWHSLRHRFARTCVDVLAMDAGMLMAMGGWESETVVRNRYYRSGKEHAEAGLEKFELMRG